MKKFTDRQTDGQTDGRTNILGLGATSVLNCHRGLGDQV